MPAMRTSSPRDPLGPQRRDVATTRVKRVSRTVAFLAAGAAAALGLIVSKEIPGTTTSADTTVSSTSSTTAGTSTASGTGSSSGSASQSSDTSASTATTVTPTTTAPSTTTKSATVVSGGTGR